MPTLALVARASGRPSSRQDVHALKKVGQHNLHYSVGPSVQEIFDERAKMARPLFFQKFIPITVQSQWEPSHDPYDEQRCGELAHG